MCEITVPSSPSWYFSNILACNDDGSALAYGAKHEVVVLRQISSHGKPSDVQPLFIPMAHKDKVTAVSFSPSNCENFKDHLVSCSEDGTVHVWNWTSQFLMLAHTGHAGSEKAMGVDWSRADPNLIVSVGDSGSVVCWDLPSNTIRKLSVPTKIHPICVACCPHDKELVAVGAKSGLMIIYRIKGDGSIKFRLRGHENDVVSLAWCPTPKNIFQKESSENAMLLASGSKDRTIYFWKAGGDGRYETYISLPTNPVATFGYRSKNGVGGQGSNWICVRWPEENMFITSSLFGELLCYDLQEHINSQHDKQKDKKNKSRAIRLIHGSHSKGLFSIAVPYGPKKDGDDKIVWTYALDKRLIASKLESAKVLTSMATIGGIVYCLAVSPIDPNRIAIGTGDNRILVWNMSNDSCENITTLWNKINNKVMAVAWHPTHESLLAFGTGEGRVGLVDVDNTTKPTILLRLHHRKSVYSLIWGPPIVGESNLVKGKKALALFSVGDGDILQYHPESAEKEPISLNSYFVKCDNIAKMGKTLGRTDLAWNADRTLAAVGNDNGVLYIVDGQNFSHNHTIFAHKKLVQCIIWHPATVTSESTPSPYASWLASASDNIQVVNVTPAGVDVVACLSTHSEKVVSLAWSPHFNTRLVSASYDYTSQVWDVASGSVLACFDGHHSAVMCCLPSMLHPDCIISGSADSTVRMWNINKYKLTKTKTKKQRLSGVLKKFSNVQEAKDAKTVGRLKITPSNAQNSSSKKISHLFEGGGGGGLELSDIIEEEEALASGPKVHAAEIITKEKRNMNMFPLTSGGTSKAKYLNVLWSRMKGEPAAMSEVNDLGYLDFFGDTNSIRRLLDVEGNHHKSTGNVAFTRYISLWSGNISETIKDAIWKKELNDHLVSLAPMVSHKLWVDCCQSYARQLAETGDVYKAVSYLLGIHQVVEAIELLIEGKYFREAVVLAKSRYSSFDPIVKRVLDAWAAHCVSTGMLSLAAHCALSSGSHIEAVEILSRSKDNAFISLAAEIASKSDAQEMAVSLALRAINGSLEKLDFELARRTASQHQSLKDTMAWIDVCSLITVWKPLKAEQAISWICSRPVDGRYSIFERAIQICKNSSYNKLLKLVPSKPTDDSENKVWVYLCGQLTLAGACHNKDQTTSFKHLVQAVAAACRYHVGNPGSPAHIFLQLCPWISPDGPFTDHPSFEKCEENLKKSLRTFFACSVIHWLEKLNKNSELPLDDTNLIDQINDLVKECSQLIFHKDILHYYKAEAELKDLEKSITSNKLKLLKSVKYCKDIEASFCGQPEANGISGSNGISCSAEITSENKTGTDNLPENKEDEAEKFAKLKVVKTTFEEERIDTPNPCLLYGTIGTFMRKMMEVNVKSKETMDEIENEIVGKAFQ